MSASEAIIGSLRERAEPLLVKNTVLVLLSCFACFKWMLCFHFSKIRDFIGC